MRTVLNVGGNTKQIELPHFYDGWNHVLLDIDANQKPDIVCDAKELHTLDREQYDSVYSSHNLEHFYPHDVSQVLSGMKHVLKDDGFAFVRVPDIAAVMRTVIEKELDVEDTLYESAAGPITAHDVIYGYGKEIEESGSDFFAHKTGFTHKSLLAACQDAGFNPVYIGDDSFEVFAIAFKNPPSEYFQQLLGL